MFVLTSAYLVAAQRDGKVETVDEHSPEIYGVKLGMTVPSALEAVFVNAGRKQGEEKPDAMRKEGKGNADIRVVYKELPAGELQILFTGGKYVSQLILAYKDKKRIEEMKLAPSGDVGTVSSGERFDDRYSIGFVDSKKHVKLWWRDEKTEQGYHSRVSFYSESLLKDRSAWWQTVVRKSVTLKPGDEKEFNRAHGID